MTQARDDTNPLRVFGAMLRYYRTKAEMTQEQLKIFNGGGYDLVTAGVWCGMPES